MAINTKKYTKEQMAKMVEEAQEGVKTAAAYEATWRNQAKNLQSQVSDLEAKNATLTEQLDQMNGEAITRENVIENLKADADALRNKLSDAEETLGRTRSVVASMQGKIACANDEIVRLKENLGWSESRANWSASHPWSNLRAWIKRKLFW